MRIFYSINDYDSDGDLVESGVFLYFGDTRIKVCKYKKDFEDIVNQIEVIAGQIRGENSEMD